METQLTLAWRYLSGRKLRSVLTTLAITFGVLVIFGLNSILPTFLETLQANAMAATGQVDATITAKNGQGFDQALAARVAAVDGVRAISPKLERTVGLPADYFDRDPAMPDRVVAVDLVGADPERIRSVSILNVVQGRFLQTRDEAAAVIAQSLAEVGGLQVGDTLRLPSATGMAELTVVGILPPRVLPGNEKILVTLPQAQKLLDMPGQINAIDANFDSVEETRRAAIEAEITAALGPSFTIAVLQAGVEILNNIQAGQYIMNLIAWLGLLMGGFIIFNTFRTIVAERRRDIGMLRSIGASRRTIIGLILIEGLVQGLIGSAAGLLLGYALARLIVVAVEPIAHQYLNLQVGSIVVRPEVVLISVAAGVGITLLAGLLPARSAGRLTPLEALRPPVGAVTLKRLTGAGFWVGVVLIVLALVGLVSGNFGLVSLGSLLFVVGLLLVSSALVNPIANLFGRLLALIFVRDSTAQLAEGNLSRQPSRAAITASTTMIGLAIVLMAASLMTSVMIGFKHLLQRSLSSEYLLMPPSVMTWGLNVGAAPTLAADLAAIEGVDSVSTLRFASTRIQDLPINLLGIDTQGYMERDSLTFSEGDPATAYRQLESGRNMIINGILAKTLGIRMGDHVSLLTVDGAVDYTVVGIATDYLNAKITTGYISHPNIAADFGRTEDVFFEINLVEGADRAAAEAAMRAAIAPYPQFTLIVGSDYYEQNAGLLDSMFMGMYAMVLFLSIPSLIAMVNTLAIGVIERTREIGMLRAVGATRRQVRTVILCEALILAAIGTTFGVLSGLYLGYMATRALDAFGFPLDYIFPGTGLAIALAAGLLFGALAAVIPARQAAGLQIVSALRYE